MQNGSYGEKENGKDSKAKDTMVQTEEDKLSNRFRQEATRILGGEHGLPDESNKTAKMLRNKVGDINLLVLDLVDRL